MHINDLSKIINTERNIIIIIDIIIMEVNEV